MIVRVEIYDAESLAGGNQWHAKKRVRELAYFSRRSNKRIRRGTFIFEDGNAFLDHATRE
jgi:hypothetical protein